CGVGPRPPASAMLLLRSFSFHDRRVVAARADFVFEVVRGRRGDLRRVAAFRNLAVHLVLVAPGPGIAVDSSSRDLFFAKAVHFVIAILLVFGPVTHDGHALAGTEAS